MRRSPTRILVVDDNEAGRYLKARLLRQAGWTVDETATGEEALQLIETMPIGIVVLDVALPGIDGFEVCRIVKERYSDVFVIHTSATYRATRDRVQGLDTGADAYMAEPMEDAELLATVRSLQRLMRAEAHLRDSEERFRLAAAASGIGVYDTDLLTARTKISPELAEILGLPSAGEISLEEGRSFVDPRDREVLAAAAGDALDSEGDGIMNVDFRIQRKDGTIRWVSLRGRTHFYEVDGEKRPARTIGALLDITDRKQWESTQHLLLGELNHRIKNTLTTVQAIASHTMRTTPDPQRFALSFNGRLQALAQAHTLLTRQSWDGAYLDDIMDDQLGDGEPGQISRSGPRVFLAPQFALRVALTLHELATNARKYGALSTPEGHLDVVWDVKCNEREALDFLWAESGGPPVEAPTHVGFGTKLIKQSLSGLGGQVDLDFAPGGVNCRVFLPIGQSAGSKKGASGAPPPS